MLRITEDNLTNGWMTFRLDGRLANEWVELLRSSCEQAFQNQSHLTLDLAGMSFADHEGVELLRQLERQQVTFINCSPFLREQMKQSTNRV